MHRSIVSRQIDNKGATYRRSDAGIVEQNLDIKQVPRMLAVKGSTELAGIQVFLGEYLDTGRCREVRLRSR